MIGWILWARAAWWKSRVRSEQELVWRDAELARLARERAEAMAAAQLAAMLEANPSGQLGHAILNDDDALERSGLL